MGRRIVFAVLGVVVILVLAFLLGPRVPVDTTIRFDPKVIGDDPQAYLAREEAAVPNIRDGLEKEIIWADPMVHAKTPLAIVYVHGFSASKGEVRPLADEVADQLDANLFYTRLTGHGQDGAAMTQGNVNAWINDYEEALAIGRAIGDKVIVIGTSTGGSLAAWAATEPGASDGVAAIAFISPNFGVRASGAELLTMPWGKQIAELVGGKERSFPTRNALHEKLWGVRLTCPGGGKFVWNDQWQTMESTVYGSPGNPRPGPAWPGPRPAGRGSSGTRAARVCGPARTPAPPRTHARSRAWVWWHCRSPPTTTRRRSPRPPASSATSRSAAT